MLSTFAAVSYVIFVRNRISIDRNSNTNGTGIERSELNSEMIDQDQEEESSTDLNYSDSANISYYETVETQLEEKQTSQEIRNLKNLSKNIRFIVGISLI